MCNLNYCKLCLCFRWNVYLVAECSYGLQHMYIDDEVPIIIINFECQYSTWNVILKVLAKLFSFTHLIYTSIITEFHHSFPIQLHFLDIGGSSSIYYFAIFTLHTYFPIQRGNQTLERQCTK